MSEKKTYAQRLAEQGVLLSYCSNCCVPQIPEVDDVLYAGRLIAQPPEAFWNSVYNGADFMENSLLVAHTCFYKVDNSCRMETEPLTGRTYGELNMDMARMVVAEAIIALLPPEAKCLFEPSYKAALEVLGEKVPPKGTPSDELRKQCTCPDCQKSRKEMAAE